MENNIAKMIEQVNELKDIVVDMQKDLQELKESNRELIELYESEIDYINARLNGTDSGIDSGIEYR